MYPPVSKSEAVYGSVTEIWFLVFCVWFFVRCGSGVREKGRLLLTIRAVSFSICEAEKRCCPWNFDFGKGVYVIPDTRKAPPLFTPFAARNHTLRTPPGDQLFFEYEFDKCRVCY